MARCPEPGSPRTGRYPRRNLCAASNSRQKGKNTSSRLPAHSRRQAASATEVNEQSHEIAIRFALGAQRRDILRMVLRQGLTLAAAGAGVGLVRAHCLSSHGRPALRCLALRSLGPGLPSPSCLNRPVNSSISSGSVEEQFKGANRLAAALAILTLLEVIPSLGPMLVSADNRQRQSPPVVRASTWKP
jgi:hypothetical protein